MDFHWTKTFIVKEDPSLNDGDKLILPSSALEELLDLSKGTHLSSPMTFALRHTHFPHKVLHGGVKEFSGEDNTVLIPSWMMTWLGFTTTLEQQRIVLQWKILPKGTWAKLRPLTDNYSDIMDYRAALESHLRQHYNTLTIGQTLTCRYGSQRYPFLVVDLRPDVAVGVNDTDLEVDLEPYQATLATTTDDIITDANSSTTLSSQQQIPSVTVNQQVQDIPISQNEYRYWSLDMGKSSQVYIELKTSSGDIWWLDMIENRQ
ncbi:ubiquitin fusion degradation protein UFD1-domain-containing protein [Chlamydoabsidia padenii]|nr:ubiquitin fusion degradation protein UFD1-domain-containing protein [Chlamydoabsidia padenii]